jgi:hypothetical protein
MKLAPTIISLCLSVLNVRSQVNNPGPQPTKDSTVYKGVTDLSCAVEMAFGSYGSGIDGKAFDKVIDLLNSKKIKFTSKNIGREGETRLCLPLKGVKKSQKKALISQLKKIAKEGQLVSISIR